MKFHGAKSSGGIRNGWHVIVVEPSFTDAERIFYFSPEYEGLAETFKGVLGAESTELFEGKKLIISSNNRDVNKYTGRGIDIHFTPNYEFHCTY